MERQTIGRYQLKELLGRGGMATVYLALDPRFQREVAIKFLPQSNLNDPMFRARFQREAQTVAALEHPAIVPVHDFGEEDGHMYLVMAYMTGGSLADRLDEGPLTPAEAARVLRRISSGLDQAHKQGIIHRDLKPANILFDRYDNAYLSDFGIVKLAQATADLTGEGVIGTPSYMSPEQARGNDNIDGRSDIYALGAILFRMLSGQVPYEAETPIGVLIKHINSPLPDLQQAAPQMAPFDPVIRKAMAKSPEDRYRTANEMVLHLDRIIGEQAALGEAGAPPPGTPPPSREAVVTESGKDTGKPRFAPWLLALGGLFVVACVAGVIVGALALREAAGSNGTRSAATDVDTPAPTAVDEILEPVSEIQPQVPAVPTEIIESVGTATPTATATGTATASPQATASPTETTAPPTSTPTPEVRNGPIVFDSADDIFVMDANGSNARQLTNNSVLDDEADISSDGRFIAYESYTGTEWNIIIMGIDGRSPRELIAGRQPDWSPDDRFIAFESASFPQQVFVVEVASGQARQITNTISHSRAPSWSPDGERLVFMTEVGTNWQLAIANVATGTHEVITTGSPDKRFPVWSPDGELIAYNTLTSGGGIDQIWTIEPSGENARRLTDDGHNGRPAWSPDGSYLLFNSNRSGSWLIYQMNADGSNQRALTNVGDRQRADWGQQWP